MNFCFRSAHQLLALGLSATLISGCKPPAADDFAERGAVGDARIAPSAPIDSPDVEGAMWADSKTQGRLLYGKSGEAPLLALTCDQTGSTPEFRITRFVVADEDASALMAIIGNGHIARLPVEAEYNDRVWLWRGRYYPLNSDLDVLSGPRQIELTIPGAGSLILTPSPGPAQLLEACRAMTGPIMGPTMGARPQAEDPPEPDE